mgnify:CR=1 FL=1
MDDLAEARALLDRAARVAVLTGAGISTASGIGDFRGPQGRWTLDPDAERVSTGKVLTASVFSSGWASTRHKDPAVINMASLGPREKTRS